MKFQTCICFVLLLCFAATASAAAVASSVNEEKPTNSWFDIGSLFRVKTECGKGQSLEIETFPGKSEPTKINFVILEQFPEIQNDKNSFKIHWQFENVYMYSDAEHKKIKVQWPVVHPFFLEFIAYVITIFQAALRLSALFTSSRPFLQSEIDRALVHCQQLSAVEKLNICPRFAASRKNKTTYYRVCSGENGKHNYVRVNILTYKEMLPLNKPVK
ncbi:hypothetical protein NQ315_011519 [Exocentrus adspersus]|uniref:Uncharacterized protein n=1 Tax=Exocentrus adspersus TaxID=1586481 RepID=A0AAV8VUM1_9CUCU|nr:hypothetical protein NQ315_011519 [Exocentrus adspersus]